MDFDILPLEKVMTIRAVRFTQSLEFVPIIPNPTISTISILTVYFLKQLNSRGYESSLKNESWGENPENRQVLNLTL